MITRHGPSHMTSCRVLIVAGLVLAHGSVQAQTTTSTVPEDENSQTGQPASQSTQPASSSLPSGGSRTARPWTLGVSPHQQKHAEVLYQEGNRDFTNGFFAAAVTKYQAALQYWNHPGIHYNLALALISLDRPIEAHESIVAALSHGTDALQPDEYQRALDYRRVLRQRIAEIEVTCDEPGAAITLDGKPLFTGPGRASAMVLPGKHQVVASKSGYLVTTKAFELAPAGRKHVELRLLAAYQPSTQVQRWPTWPQWAATGLGLGAGVVAAGLHWQFRTDTRGLKDAWRQSCEEGCTTYPSTLDSLRERVEWQRNVAYAGYATAGTFLTLGAVLTYLNRPQTVEAGARHETVQVSAGGPAGSAGVSIHVPF
jgi:hypothetical protein